jgi:hypothetical protein
MRLAAWYFKSFQPQMKMRFASMETPGNRAENHVNYYTAQRLWHAVDFGPKAQFIPASGNAPGIRVVSDHERQRSGPSGSMKTDVEMCGDTVA